MNVKTDKENIGKRATIARMAEKDTDLGSKRVG